MPRLKPKDRAEAIDALYEWEKRGIQHRTDNLALDLLDANAALTTRAERAEEALGDYGHQEAALESMRRSLDAARGLADLANQRAEQADADRDILAAEVMAHRFGETCSVAALPIAAARINSARKATEESGALNRVRVSP